jgi:hypothetical protein
MHHATRVAAATFLALALAAPARPAELGEVVLPSWLQRDQAPTTRAIASALRDARRAPDGPAEAVVERLARADSVADLLVILEAEHIPEVEPGDARQVLSAPQRALVLAALARAPAVEVRARLAPRLQAAAEGDQRAALLAVRVLGAVGGARDLQRMAALAPRRDTVPPTLSRDARTALRSAAESVLMRDPRAWVDVVDVIRTTDGGAARPLIEAVSARPDPRALAVLADAARMQPGLAPLCVAGALKVGRPLDPEVARLFADWIAAELPAARPEYRRSLYQALGTLDDGAHARLLVEALSDEDAGARDSALWALRRLSGFGFADAPEPWLAWLDAEERWHLERLPRLRGELAARDAARAAAALRECAGRRAWRESLAAEITPVLDRGEVELRVLTCEVLESLRALAAIRPLAAALADPEQRVRDAAWRALGAITGLDLPRDAAAAAEDLQIS